jgi:hypothetical protein
MACRPPEPQPPAPSPYDQSEDSLVLYDADSSPPAQHSECWASDGTVYQRGERYKEDCNWCICGLGVARCTLMASCPQRVPELSLSRAHLERLFPEVVNRTCLKIP